MHQENTDQALTPLSLKIKLGERTYEIEEPNVSKARALRTLAGRIMDKTKLAIRVNENGDSVIDPGNSSKEGLMALGGRVATYFCDNFECMKPDRAYIENDPHVFDDDLKTAFYAVIGYLDDPFGLKAAKKAAKSATSTGAQTPIGEATSTRPSPTTGEPVGEK